MQVQYRAIKVACPQCGKERAVNVPETLFSQKKYGHIKIQVPKGAVCQDHVFVVFLDVQARILGYEKVDLSISTPIEPKIKEEYPEEDSGKISLEQFIEIIGFNCFAGLIHAKLFNYPLYLIVENEFKVNLDEINKVLDEIMPDMYKNTRSLKTIRYTGNTFPVATYFYALVQNQRRTAFLMNPSKHIIQMPWDTGLELEKSIISSVINNKKEKKEIKDLNYYINKFLEDVDYTLSLLKSTKKISKKELVKTLNERSITSNIHKNHIGFIKEFIYRRKSSDLAKKIRD